MAKGSILFKEALVALAALSSLPTSTAHSWVEQLQRIAANGTMMTAVGYQRGFVARDNPVFKGDITDDLWQLPANALGRTQIYNNDTICSPQQSTSNYTSDFPRLVTAAGDYIALRHEENGHVSLPQNQQNKPRNRGTIYIYGTENSLPNDTLVAIHKVWNVNGTGGDGRGRLLATRNYDDGQCYQVNDGNISTSRQAQFDKVASDPEGADLWCQSDIQLPSDITTGANFTLYWVWDWPTLNKANAMVGEAGVNVTREEIYTSCIDLQIVDACSDELSDSAACSSSSSSSSNSTSIKTTKTNLLETFDKSQSYGSAAVPQELTGNFAVSVDDTSADSGSNDGMSAPPNLATASATTSGGAAAAGTATASTFQTVTTSKSQHTSTNKQGGHTVTVALSTVTVTAGVTTTTVTATTANAAADTTSTSTATTATGAAAAAAASASDASGLVAEESDGHLSVPIATPGVPPAVTPFMRRRRSRISILE